MDILFALSVTTVATDCHEGTGKKDLGFYIEKKAQRGPPGGYKRHLVKVLFFMPGVNLFLY